MAKERGVYFNKDAWIYFGLFLLKILEVEETGKHSLKYLSYFGNISQNF